VSDLEALQRLLTDFRHSTFHLEALDRYTVEGEIELVEAFIRGEPQPPRIPAIEEWVAGISRLRSQGRRMTRVHAIAGPLTPYLRYEIEWAYTGNSAAGEDIQIAHFSSWRESPYEEQPPDFYLIDDEMATLMHYDGEGRWLGFDLVTGEGAVEPYRRLRDLSLHHAMTLQRYLMAMRAAPLDPLALRPERVSA
jgi:hypothetical protein